MAVGLALWEGMAALFQVPGWLLPRPSNIGMEMASSYPLLLGHTWVTLQEVLVGVAASLVAGVSVAMAIAYWRTVERALYPFVIASQAVPIVAIAPILLIWFGYGLLPKVIVVVLISFFPIVVNMVDGLRSVDPDMVNMMRTLGARRRHVFTKVQIPGSLPFLFSGVRIALAVSVIGAVIGEWVGSSAGLGYLILQSTPRFLTARVFAAILILALLGMTLFFAVSPLERLVMRWYRTGKREKVLEELG